MIYSLKKLSITNLIVHINKYIIREEKHNLDMCLQVCKDI